MWNASSHPWQFELPPVAAGSHERWRRCVDTTLASGDDMSTRDAAPQVELTNSTVGPRSIVLCACPPEAAPAIARRAK
jgi:hypothetical protein